MRLQPAESWTVLTVKKEQGASNFFWKKDFQNDKFQESQALVGMSSVKVSFLEFIIYH